jgi:hypothetical protein
MSKWLRFCRKGLMIGVACGLGLLAFGGREASAGIVLMMSVNGAAPVDITPLFTPSTNPPDPGQLNSLGSPNLDAINALLVGSAYTFTGLSGTSNWAGSPSGGSLSLGGTIEILPGHTGSTLLTLTETESGFTSPSGPSGTLMSSSSATFTNAPPPNSHDANSSFNAITTPTYAVTSTGAAANSPGAMVTTPIPAFVTPYTLTNFISFHLTPSANSTPTDVFGVGASVTAIPEPVSMVMMMIGLPVPLMGIAWLRRHRAGAKA